MPNISAHMIVAQEVGKKLRIKSDAFIRGNLLPDIIDMDDSHYKIKNGIYFVPNIKYCLENLDFSDDLYIGYLVHLLLDKKFLEDYLGQLYPGENVFLDGEIYNDYNYLNSELVNQFKLDLDSLEKILTVYSCKILEKKLKYNIDCLKQKKINKTKYLYFDSFSKFLLDTSEVISEELSNYANKHSNLSIRLR